MTRNGVLNLLCIVAVLVRDPVGSAVFEIHVTAVEQLVVKQPFSAVGVVVVPAAFDALGLDGEDLCKMLVEEQSFEVNLGNVQCHQ
jgi:hypothetical protein